ncbi:MAG: SGNH/GDSL hydrolase family protein [Acidobacteriota bacterium]
MLGPASYAALAAAAVLQAAALLAASRARSSGGLSRIVEGVVVAVASTAILLTAGEVGLRLLHYGDRDARFGRSLEIVRHPNEDRVESGMPYHLNSMGFRDEELPAARLPGETRVLCLGDSSTFGFWVGQEEAYPQVLERILRDRTGNPAQVINAGAVGASSFQGRQLYERLAPRLPVDWVVVAFGHNDRWLRPLPDARGGTGKLVACVLQSRIFVLLEHALAPLRRSRQERYVPRVSAWDYGRNLAAIAELAHGHGARTIVLWLPENPAMTLEVARARALHAGGKDAEALRVLAPITRLAALNPYPDAYELQAEIAAVVGDEELARKATAEAALRVRTAPRDRDEESYRHAIDLVAEVPGTRVVAFDPRCVAGKFLDVCHPTPAFHAEIGRGLSRAILEDARGCCGCAAQPGAAATPGGDG